MRGSVDTGGTTSSDAYVQCQQVPSGSIVQHNCPGLSATWNNYEVKIDSLGNVTSIELWCGGNIIDHPDNQSEYDRSMVSAGYSSNQDNKQGIDCVSGSKETLSGDVVFNIWQKQ